MTLAQFILKIRDQHFKQRWLIRLSYMYRHKFNATKLDNNLFQLIFNEQWFVPNNI